MMLLVWRCNSGFIIRFHTYGDSGRCLLSFFYTKDFHMKKFLLFVLAIVISFAPGLIGIMFTPMGHNDAWFNGLNQSVLTPTPLVFAVVWTILYFLLGVALFLIIQNNRTRYNKTKPYLLFVAQMALNALWTYLFFGLHMAGAAMIVIALLLIISIWMMRAFSPISRGASMLVLPYILWLILATYLNGMILYLN